MDKQFNQEQLKKVKRLCRECANYDNGICIILSDWERDDIACVQLISLHIWCNYFKKAVLPLNPVLAAELTGDRSKLKQCARCGKDFSPGSNRAQYCRECKMLVRRKAKAEYMERYRKSVDS